MNWTYLQKVGGGTLGAFIGAAALSFQLNPTPGYKTHVLAGAVAAAGYLSGLFIRRPQDPPK